MLNLITKNKLGVRPPRIILYGVHGIGKTSISACFPKPIFIRTEDGLGNIEVDSFPLATSSGQVLTALDALIAEEHDFKTVVLDSLDWYENICHQELCAKLNVTHLSNTPYQSGFSETPPLFDKLLKRLQALQEKGMTILLIAHATIVQFKTPNLDSYDKYDIALHKLVRPKFHQWCDLITFLNYHVQVVPTGDAKRKRGIGDGGRIAYFQEHPAVTAKNRYDMPESITYETNQELVQYIFSFVTKK